MNKFNLDAINRLFEMPPRPETGVNDNFYWAVRGNWPEISKMLAAALQPEVGSRNIPASDCIFGKCPGCGAEFAVEKPQGERHG